MIDLEKIKSEAQQAVLQIIELGNLKRGEILVVGCSTSEVLGQTIGKASVPQVAEAIVDGILPLLAQRGIFLAGQCCEHLNRALIVSSECAEKYGLCRVCVRPVPNAGGSFAAALYERMEDAVAVEQISAHAGIDIGGTLIGMHLRAVAVPRRIKQSYIGMASVSAATTRPKFVGGPRAQYPEGVEADRHA